MKSFIDWLFQTIYYLMATIVVLWIVCCSFLFITAALVYIYNLIF